MPLKYVAVVKLARSPNINAVRDDEGALRYTNFALQGDGKVYYGSVGRAAVDTGEVLKLVEDVDFEAVTDQRFSALVGSRDDTSVLDIVMSLNAGDVVVVDVERTYDYIVPTGARPAANGKIYPRKVHYDNVAGIRMLPVPLTKPK